MTHKCPPRALGGCRIPLRSNGLFAVPSWVQLFVCFWPFTPFKTCAAGEGVCQHVPPPQVPQASAPGRRRMRDGGWASREAATYGNSRDEEAAPVCSSQKSSIRKGPVTVSQGPFLPAIYPKRELCQVNYHFRMGKNFDCGFTKLFHIPETR